MRVEVNTPAEFKSELQVSRPLDDIVRYRIDHISTNDDSPMERIGLWLTSIIASEHGNYILECGWDCGEQDGRPGREKPASDQAEDFKEDIAELCDELGLKLRLGKWELM